MVLPTFEQSCDEYLIETNICEGDPVDFEDVCETIRRLGGVKVDGGFSFATARDRAVALELLGDKFGTRYVVAVSGKTRPKPR